MTHLIEGAITPAFVAERLTAYQENGNCGAHAFFLGQVRSDQKSGAYVVAIEYSAYEGMAENDIEKIAKEINDEFKVSSVEIYHSTGLIKSGEYSVLIIINSDRRKKSLAALNSAVERVKYDIPIWKKEQYSDGSHHWVDETKKREEV